MFFIYGSMLFHLPVVVVGTYIIHSVENNSPLINEEKGRGGLKSSTEVCDILPRPHGCAVTPNPVTARPPWSAR
jgi:hypothetical protein